MKQEFFRRPMCVVCERWRGYIGYRLRFQTIAVCARCEKALRDRVVGISRKPDGSLSITDARQAQRGTK